LSNKYKTVEALYQILFLPNIEGVHKLRINAGLHSSARIKTQ